MTRNELISKNQLRVETSIRGFHFIDSKLIALQCIADIEYELVVSSSSFSAILLIISRTNSLYVTMDFCETRTSFQLICAIPVRNNLTTIIKCSAWSQIDSRWSPSELNINVLVSAVYIIWLSYACCISLLGETYVSCKASLTWLECSISLLIINSPLKNLCFSAINIHCCMLNNTNLVNWKQCSCVQFSLIKLIKI